MAGKRTLFMLVVAGLVVGCCAWPALAAPASEIHIQGVDTSGYPNVSFRVSLQGFSSTTSGRPRVGVVENGSEIRDVKVDALSQQRTAANVVLLVDTSGSMEGQPLADAREAVGRFVQTLGPDARVALVAFSDRPRLVTPFTADAAALSKATASLQPAGETALYDALVLGAQLTPKTLPGTRSIVLLSDGGDTASDSSFERAAAAIRSAGTPVYVVALHSEEYNPKALSTVSQITGGKLVSASGSKMLAGLFEGIAKEIGNSWHVSYRSVRQRTKDVDLDITVALGDTRAKAAVAYQNPDFTGAADSGAGGQLLPSVKDDPAMLLAFTIVAFVSVAALAAAILLLLLRERSALDQLHFYDQLHDDTSGTPSGGILDNATSKMVEAVGVVAAKRGILSAVSVRLEAAGLPLRAAEYVTLHLLAVVVLGVLAQLVSGRFIVSFAAVGIVTVVPILLLQIAVDRRKSRFESQLPDVLNMMSGSLRGGWGIQQAIGLVVQEAPSPSAEEFKRVETESRLGMPLERSLQSMAERMDSSAFHAAVSAIAIQREVGGNLAEVLDVVASTIREHDALRRHVKALTAEGRFSAYILVALPFLMLFALLAVNPEYLSALFTTPLGLAFAVTGAVLLVVGSIWLRQATKIEV